MKLKGAYKQLHEGLTAAVTQSHEDKAKPAPADSQDDPITGFPNPRLTLL